MSVHRTKRKITDLDASENPLVQFKITVKIVQSSDEIWLTGDVPEPSG